MKPGLSETIARIGRMMLDTRKYYAIEEDVHRRSEDARDYPVFIREASLSLRTAVQRCSAASNRGIRATNALAGAVTRAYFR